MSLTLLSHITYFPCKTSTCQSVQDAVEAVNNFLTHPERCCFFMEYVQKVMLTFEEIICVFWKKNEGLFRLGKERKCFHRSNSAVIRFLCDNVVCNRPPLPTHTSYNPQLSSVQVLWKLSWLQRCTAVPTSPVPLRVMVLEMPENCRGACGNLTGRKVLLPNVWPWRVLWGSLLLLTHSSATACYWFWRKLRDVMQL